MPERLERWQAAARPPYSRPMTTTLRLPAVLGDGMVLQRGRPLPVWGRARPGASVTARLAGRERGATAGPDGRWRVVFEPLEEGRGLELRVSDGDTERVRTDLLVGEVWLCAGQSNMEWTIDAGILDGERERAAATHPDLRLFKVPRCAAVRPRDDTGARWTPCRPGTAGAFSAVGYVFGRELHRALGVPVGLVGSAWGGTRAEAWCDRETLASSPALRRLAPPDGGWEEAAPGDEPAAATLFNGMVAPLVPFALRGAAWYQGESNVDRAFEYRALLTALVRNWRERWGLDDLAFLVVQLANCGPVRDTPGESAWAELREAQQLACALPHTGLATAIDIGEAADIHPRNKPEVGRRLARVALRRVYGRPVESEGPRFTSMRAEGGAARVRFAHAAGLHTADGAPPREFAVAGEDRRFHAAEARIEGEEVVARSAAVPRPAAVRYAWADSPVCNLVNGAGLPALPFRTDDWPVSAASAA